MSSLAAEDDETIARGPAAARRCGDRGLLRTARGPVDHRIAGPHRRVGVAGAARGADHRLGGRGR